MEKYMTEKKTSGPDFSALTEATPADWQHITGKLASFADRLPDRVLAHLQLLEGDGGGFPVDRLQHCLQTATLAYRDGRDEEFVVMALLHDIGDILSIYSHADMAAALLKPFVSNETHWIVQQHGLFQGYYFFHHIGLDRDAREVFRGHPCFAAAAEFVEKYDQRAFDARYDTAPLSFFEPMVRRVMAEPRNAFISRNTVNLS
ncbi:putative HD phosphohydrolase [Rhizorhapis suberifaciens]|uniref:Putative HD phosphohydrolase n=2 Tax=Rhizorhapis suberifaciens TaxID=13656 RepID=A0A840HTR6_9SPHN|nr:putative HD phosphohydrolase [Rhizorhapis suberifaciens]